MKNKTKKPVEQTRSVHFRGNLQSAVVLVAFLIIIIISDGCTLLGLGIGDMVDVSKPDQRNIPARELQGVKAGTEIEIITTTGDTITGRYDGLAHLTEQEYAAMYGSSRENMKDVIVLPELRDRVMIKFATGEQRVGKLLGFDYRATPVMAVEEDGVTQLDLSSISEIVDSQGNVTEATTLISLIFDRRIPTRSAVLLEGASEKKSIALGKIFLLKVPNRKNGKLYGLLIGASIDLLVMVAVTEAVATSWTLGQKR